MMEQIKLFEENENLFLSNEFIGKELKNGGFTKNNPRQWTKGEIDWMLSLKNNGLNNSQIGKYIYRDNVSVSIKLKRLKKADGKKYNEKHRLEKYETNRLFLDIIKPKSVLDLFSGEKSFYFERVNSLTTNDSNNSFNTNFNEKAEKLICRLYYENKKFDLIDIDPFGSAFDCFDLSIKMATKGLILTFGEMGHKRFNRIDFVKRYYGINSLDEFTIENLIRGVQKIGLRNKKNLIPVHIKNWHNISRVYFKIEKIRITEQWEK
jgi:hypothetical protein